MANVYGDQEGDSVVSAVFAVAWQRFGEIPSDRTAEWLKSVARHVVLNTRRSDARWASLQRAARDTAEAEAASVDDDRRLEVKVVVAALPTLSHADQYILRLQASEEPTSEELAMALGISVRAARTRLSRARTRLQEACERLFAGGEAAP